MFIAKIYFLFYKIIGSGVQVRYTALYSVDIGVIFDIKTV